MTLYGFLRIRMIGNSAGDSQTFFSQDSNPEGKPLEEIFKDIGIPDENIADFKKQLKESGWVRIPQIKIMTEGGIQYFSLFSTFTDYKNVSALSGLQGQFIDRTQEILLEKQQERMASQIRHDMKNRISATLMGSDAVLQEWKFLKPNMSLPEETKEFYENLEITLAEIKANSTYLSNLVRQMLDISKLQSGKLSLRPGNFNVKDALRQVVSALRAQQETRQIEVLIVGDPLNVEADFVQLSRVLENYHSNALKYTKSKVVWHIEKENDQLLVWVQDDGEGIAVENLTRIFDPFFQVAGKEKEGSTGLGLDSVKELVKLHKGQTWAESDGPGLGSRFFVKIPLTQT